MFVVAIVMAAAGCGDSKTTSTEATPAVTTPPTSTPVADGTVNVTLDEYTVKPSTATVSAGKVTFNVENKGSIEHEMIVAKTDLAEDKLPTEKGNSDQIDEAGAGLDAIGEVPELKAGKSGSVSLELKAGNYVLFCNVAKHYGYGQHTTFKVE